MTAITAPAVTTADIEAMIPTVEALVSTKYRLHGAGIDRDDLIQAGMLGVCKAAKRFTPGKSAFRTYAYMRAHGEIRDYLRTLQAGTRSYAAEEPLSLNQPKSNALDEDRTIGDDLHVEDDYDDLVWTDLKRDIGHRDARILWLYTHGYRLHEIGSEQGVTECRISQRISRVRPVVRAWADREAA